MSAQTSYSINTPTAYAGMVYAQAPSDVVSRSVETVAGIDFGVAVSRGTNKDKQVTLGGTDYLGVTVRSLEREGVMNTGAIKYSEKESASVLRLGYIYAVCPAGCVPGDAVKYTNATGVLDAGAAAAGETQLDGAKWESTTTAGGIGIVRIESSATTAGA